MQDEQTILVLPVAGGWSVQCPVTDNTLMFSSGARAEAAARRLATCLAGIGQDVRVAIHDRGERLIANSRYRAEHGDKGLAGRQAAFA